MSLLIKKIDKSEINHSLLELKRRMDKAVYKNQSVKLMVTQNSAFLSSAFNRVSNWIYRISYYQNILDSAVGAVNKQRDRLETALSTLQGELKFLQDQLATNTERYKAIQSQLSAARKARDDAEKVYNQAVTDYNNWINSYYNPTKASLESDLTAANQTLFRERAELTRLRNLYNEKVAAKATAQADLNAVISALSDTPGSSWTGKTRTFYPSLSVTFTYGAGTYTVPAVSGGYSVRYSETSTNISRGIQVQYMNSSGASVSIVYRTSESTSVTNWWSVISSAYSGWKAAYLAAYQSAVDSLQDDIDELYDEISNQEEIVYDAEDAVESIEGDLRDLEDEKDEYYEDNVQTKYDDWQEKASVVTNLETEANQISQANATLREQIQGKEKEIDAAQKRLDEFNGLHPPSEDSGNTDESKSTDNDWRS